MGFVVYGVYDCPACSCGGSDIEDEDKLVTCWNCGERVPSHCRLKVEQK